MQAASSDAIGELTHPAYRPNLFPFQEIRSDIGLFLERIIIAIDAVGDQRVARDDRVLVELDRTHANDGGLLAAGPFKRGGARRPLASGYRIGERRALDEGLHRPKLPQRLPVHVERSRKAGGEQTPK